MKVSMTDLQNGLHLFHFGMSNCSQRVRICLFEKGVDWESHPVDMVRNEHASEWFQQLNPLGLIPVLVHDGDIVTESIDIIRHIDKRFPDKSLIPSNQLLLSEMENILRFADGAQGAIKLLSHEFLFKPSRFAMGLGFKKFSRNHGNSELVAFRKRFINNEFTEEELNAAIEEMSTCYSILEESLSKKTREETWLVGGRFSLADVAWMVNVHRMELIGFPLDLYPHISEWYRACKHRESFKKGLSAYEPTWMKMYTKLFNIFYSKEKQQYFERARIARSVDDVQSTIKTQLSR